MLYVLAKEIPNYPPC